MDSDVVSAAGEQCIRRCAIPASASAGPTRALRPVPASAEPRQRSQRGGGGRRDRQLVVAVAAGAVETCTNATGSRV